MQCMQCQEHKHAPQSLQTSEEHLRSDRRSPLADVGLQPHRSTERGEALATRPSRCRCLLAQVQGDMRAGAPLRAPARTRGTHTQAQH